jgi:hypothetical protein
VEPSPGANSTTSSSGPMATCSMSHRMARRPQGPKHPLAQPGAQPNEHGAQRTAVTALVDEADDGSARNIADRAEEIAWFAKALERDMGREEAELLTPSALGEEYVVIDQDDG